MDETYSIPLLVAREWYARQGITPDDGCYECPDGRADLVALDGDHATLASVRAKRLRGEPEPPRYSTARLEHIAMRFIVDHPNVTVLCFDVLDVLICEGATARVSVAVGAYEWLR